MTLGMEGVKLAYDMHQPINSSSGPPIIIIHGLYWNKEMFKDLARLMCNVMHRTIYTVDLRNHGDSPSTKQLSCELMVKDLELFFKDRGIKQATLICHSFSTTIAHMFAVNNPEFLEAIVLVDRIPYTDDKDEYIRYCRMQFVGQNRFLGMIDPRISLQEAKTKLRNYECSSEGQKIFMTKVANDLIRTNGKFGWKVDLEFLYKKAEEGDLCVEPYEGTYDGDILVVRCSESIRISDHVFSAFLQRNPNARLATVNDATHLLMLEKPHEFVREVRRFLNREKTSELTN